MTVPSDNFLSRVLATEGFQPQSGPGTTWAPANMSIAW